MLEGHLTVRCGDEEFAAGPGAFVYTPRGVAHTFRLEDGVPARLLVLLTPGGGEGFFVAAGHRRLLLSWQSLAPSIGAMLAVTSTADPRVDSILHEHQQILDGIKVRDVAMAQQSVRVHLADAREVIEQTYQQERPNFPAG